MSLLITDSDVSFTAANVPVVAPSTIGATVTAVAITRPVYINVSGSYVEDELGGLRTTTPNATTGVWSLTLPWPSETRVATQWQIKRTNGSFLTGTVPEGVAGPVNCDYLLTQLGDTNWVETITPGTASITTSTGAQGPAGATGATGATGMYAAYLLFQDIETLGTGAGTFSSGSWQTRVLNTKVADTASIGSLASNQITLPAGTYLVRASAPACGVSGHQLQLYNVTASTTLVTGQNALASNTLTTPVLVDMAHLQGRFTLSGTSVLALQHRCVTTEAAVGLGIPLGWGPEVYATMEFWLE